MAMTDQSGTSMLERHEKAAREFLPQVKLIIGGEERDRGDGGEHHHINPATGCVQAEVPLAGPRQIDEAVRAARTALGPWQRTHPAERRRILSKFADLVRAHNWTEVSVLENGQPWDQAGNMAGFGASWVDYYAGWADRIEGEVTADNETDGFIYTVPEPHGVVAMIITWNAPVLSLAMKLPAALAAGNTIVLKPAEFTSFTAMDWMQLAREAGIPDGVINLVPGGPDAGEALVAHPGVDKISFTGGPPTAKSIMRGAAEQLTPVLFELGGKGANLIFDDADLAEVVPFSCGFALTNTGQGCALPTRMLVQRGVYDEVIGRIETVMPHLTVGDPLVSGHLGGPLVNQAALKWVALLIRRGFVSMACEVDGAGGVEGFLGGAGRASGVQQGVLVAVVGGGVDGEAEGVGGAAVAEPEQRDLLAVAEHAGDVGEAAVVPGPDFGQLRPVGLGVIQQPQDDGAAGRFRDGGHVAHHAARPPRAG